MAGRRFISHLAAVLLLTASASAQSPDAATLYEEILALGDAADFPPPSGPVEVSHAAHPETRSESWVFTAHLVSETGEQSTLQASFARLGLRAGAETAFDATALFRGNAILANGEAGIRAEERFSRGLGAAGADGAGVWIDDWSLVLDATGGLALSLPLADRAVSLALKTRPANDPLLTAQDDAPFRGYSLPAVPVAATIDGQTLSGTAWFDHFWGDVPLPGGPLAYDRLIIHLDDGSAISLIRTRRRDGAGITTLDGALVDALGTPAELSDETVTLTDTSLSGAGLDLSFDILAAGTSEFVSPVATSVLAVTGTRDGAPVAGIGTLQLSGAGE